MVVAAGRWSLRRLVYCCCYCCWVAQMRLRLHPLQVLLLLPLLL
jgi:hypothetical protein